MLDKIRQLDQLVLDNISKMHSPVLNFIMKTASRSANVGIIWFVICLPFLFNREWRNTGFNFLDALVIAHLNS